MHSQHAIHTWFFALDTSNSRTSTQENEDLCPREEHLELGLMRRCLVYQSNWDITQSASRTDVWLTRTYVCVYLCKAGCQWKRVVSRTGVGVSWIELHDEWALLPYGSPTFSVSVSSCSLYTHWLWTLIETWNNERWKTRTGNYTVTQRFFVISSFSSVCFKKGIKQNKK